MQFALLSPAALGGAILAAALLGVGAAAAGPRTSASYTVTTDVADDGGQRATSASYTHSGSAGGVLGLSLVAAPAELARAGYLAQLAEPVGLAVTAAAPGVNERASIQLGARQLLDDATQLPLAAGSVSWSVQSGPLVSIAPDGLATAATVYQDTPATAQASAGGVSGTLTLTVWNVTTDDFGAYAADGIDDAWQVQYFGPPPNANAAPGADPSGTGQNNLFKFVAGLNPLDGSRFTLTAAPVPGQPGQKTLVFSPVVPGRTYVVTAQPTLTSPTWTPISASAPVDTGNTRAITDLSASGPAKFYRVEITKP